MFMKSKKKFVLASVISLVMAGLPAVSVQAADSMDEIRAALGPGKKAFIEQHMKLTQSEGAKFWPLYFAYQEGLGKLSYRVQGNYKFLLRSWTSMTDTAIKDVVSENVSIEDERGELSKEYAKKFLKVMPASKVAHYFVLEYKFRSVINYDMAAGLPVTR